MLFTILFVVNSIWVPLYSAQNVSIYSFSKDAKTTGGKYVSLKIENQNPHTVFMTFQFRFSSTQDSSEHKLNLSLKPYTSHVQFWFHSASDSVVFPQIDFLRVSLADKD
jgi:hypothetical protein